MKAWKALQDKTWWRVDGSSWSGLQGLLLLTPLHHQCWAWEVFAVLGAVSLFLEADAPSWELYLFSSTCPKKNFPLFSVHQNSKVILKLSAAVETCFLFLPGLAALAFLCLLWIMFSSLPVLGSPRHFWHVARDACPLLYPRQVFQPELPFGRKCVSSWKPNSCSL